MMNKYLEALNKLQDTFTECGVSIKDLHLPQIAVVGCQSAGKSSVLESIAKQDLLPRGTGIVTRRPLVLQMINEPKPLQRNNINFHSWAYFLHLKDTLFLNMKDVQEEIINDTNRVCGSNKGISDKPIHLKLHSTSVPSLTLIDLPGLTKIPVGDQPKDIDIQIQALVKSYVNNPDTIILAISPGNVDIANSDSLSLARKVDPKGLRTLGVITKVDLMEDSAETINLLQGKSVNMRLGLVGVINRNNDLLRKGMSAEQAVLNEKKYLLQRFPSLCDIMGITYLSGKLCELLMKKLKKALPGVAEEVEKQLLEHRKRLKELGDEVTDARVEIVNLIVNFNGNLSNSFLGKATQKYDEAFEFYETYTDLHGMKQKRKVVKTLKRFYSGGSKLMTLMESKFKRMDKLSITDNLTHIDDYILASTGYQPALFVPDSVFSVIIAENVGLLEQPILDVINTAKDCVDKLIDDCCELTFKRFPKLETEVSIQTKEILQKQVPRIKDFMNQFLAIQKGFINTRNPQFDDRYEIASNLFTVNEDDETEDDQCTQQVPANNLYAPLPNALEVNSPLNKEKVQKKEKKLMVKLLERYFDIIKDTLKDTLLKAVVRILVNDFVNECNTSILSKILDLNYSELLHETSYSASGRVHSLKMIETLTKAKQLLVSIGFC